MKNKMPKQRIIYSNYDLIEDYPDEEIRENLIENGVDGESITENQIWDERNLQDEFAWDEAQYTLENFFNNTNDKFILVGTVGCWNGTYGAGTVFETFKDFFYKATADCDYIKFYDENGHLYLTCSHHDGTCRYEIKQLTEKGMKYFKNWENGYDNRSERFVHSQIFKYYSKLPRFMEKTYGAPKTEWEPISKDRLITSLRDQARSNYS